MVNNQMNEYGYQDYSTDDPLMPHVLTDSNSVGYGGGVESLTENSYPFEKPSTLKGSTPMATVNTQSYYKNNGGGGSHAITQKVLFELRPEFDGFENPVSFEQAVVEVFSDFPVVLAFAVDTEGNHIAISFNNNSVKDDCLAYFRLAYANSGQEGETSLEALETILETLEPNVIYTSENIPVEAPSLLDIGEVLMYGIGFGTTPFALVDLEGFNMRHVPFNTNGGIIMAKPVYNYNTTTEQLSLYYEAFSQM